jgi:DNA-binding NarL/FixJ family response regulator
MRILLIDDHRLFREAIGHVLMKLDDKVVLIEAGTAEEAISMVRHYQDLDLVLLDLGMPGMGGLSGLPRLLEAAPTVPIVVVSGSTHAGDVRSAIGAGAAGYIPKTFSSHELSAALRLVLAGEIYVPPEMLPVLDADRRAGSASGGEVSAARPEVSLTPRQMEVLRLMGSGLSNKSIASRLDLSEGTVKLHVNAILRALNARNRTEAVVEATRRRLLVPPDRI